MHPMTTLKQGTYSRDEDRLLEIDYPHKGPLWCAIQLNRAPLSIRNRVQRLGIKMTDEGKWAIKSESYKRPNEWYKVNPSQFFDVKKPEAAYMLGFLWADGYVKIPKRSGGGNYILALNISKADFDNLGRAFNPLGEWGTYRVNKTKRHRVETICIRTGNKPLVEFLVENDYSIKSTASPTKILSRIPSHLKHYFWRGYFDGDGTFTCKKRNYVLGFSGAYDTDWSEHSKMLKSIGVDHHLSQEKRSSGTSSSIHAYNVSNVVRFGDYIYDGYVADGIGLKRKWDRYSIAKEVDRICQRVNAVRFSEPLDFIRSVKDILLLIERYPMSVSRAKVLDHFSVLQGTFDHMIYRLRKQGLIKSHLGKCGFYSLVK